DYCGPRSYTPVPDRLYRNRRDGTFVDVTAEAGVAREKGPALGVVAADFNADGWADIYVANDGEPNFLWINQQNGRFKNTSLLAGAALNSLGNAEGSMGVDAGDFDNDGDEDLFMTNLVGETNTLYVNDGSAVFEDRTASAGLGVPSLPYTGFGTAWFDFDNDGWLDLFVANGAVRILEGLARTTDRFPLHERNQLFRNLGRGRLAGSPARQPRWGALAGPPARQPGWGAFEEVTARAGAVFALSEVSRGAAFGDVDNDGDVDVLVTNNNGPARLLINDAGRGNRWVGLRLVGGPGRRDMLGARVGVFRDEDPPLWRRARADGSYASANDPRVLVGLGHAATVRRVRVIWPNGRVEDWTDIPIDRWITLKEGSGTQASTRRPPAGGRPMPGLHGKSDTFVHIRAVQARLVSGLVAASVLLASGSARAGSFTGGETRSASAQATAAEPTLLPVVLPDLSDMHQSVQEQFRAAYASLVVLQSERAAEEPASEPRRDERSDAYGELGKLLMAGKYLDVAERCFRNAQMLAPSDFRWPYYLGHLFISQGELTKAVERFEQVLRLRPTDFPTLVWLGYVYIELGQPDAAEPLLTRARALSPDTPAVLYQLGRASLAKQDYATAVEDLEAALRLNPGATVVHYPLAMAYRALGDLEKAQSNLDRTRGRAGPGATVTIPDPLMAEVRTVLRSPEVHGELGRQASNRGDWPEAARQFRKAIELSPDNAVMRLNLALTLNRMGDARAAVAELEAAIRVDPRLARAHYMMGTLLERSGRDQEAIDRYTAAVTHDPRFREAHLRLADALRRIGRLDASLSAYQRVLELDPDSEEARFGEAMALVRLTRHQEARGRLRIAMTLHPDQPAFPQALARLLAASPDSQVRDGQRALDLVQALAEKNKTTSVAETMAMALAEVGRFAEAAEWQRLAMSVAVDAGHPDAARRMAANLALYQRHEPCRTPWRDDDPEFRPGPKVEPGLLDPPRF
ncbi:MAG: tetratricopeptide repeat protein, partial [Acidobacteria bacterium]|nr:tetratricopeptide repeat protein [Acidobacteriota bacterium]